jgi:hypothetical protein
MPALAAIGAAVKIGGAIIQGARAKREAKRYRKQQKALNDKMNHLEANRQDIINPYDLTRFLILWLIYQWQLKLLRCK